MKVRTFDTAQTEPYIPLYDNERTKKMIDPKYDALTFHLLSMSYRDKKSWDGKVRMSIDPKTQEYRTNEDALNEEVFLKYVSRIENLEGHDGTPIVKASQFLDYIEADQHGMGIDCDIRKLYQEVLSAVLNRATLEKGLEKNFDSSSVSGLTTKPDEASEDASTSRR